MNKKFQVFVSSTYTDLIGERQDTLKSILDLGHIPSGMEGFFAADQEQLSYIKKIIDECDYYLLIVAGRYGSVDEEGISYTEREYDYAVSRGITVLAFVHSDIASLSPAMVVVDADPDSAQRLKSFRDKVSKRRLVRFWRDREQLKSDIIISLVKAMGDAPGVGWVRGNLAATETILTQLNEVRNEVERLRSENQKLIDDAKPRIDDIAGLDENFRIKFSYYSKSNKQRYDSHIDLSWSQIFTIIGPAFFSPSSPQKVDSSLDAHIAKLSGKSIIHLHPGVVDTIRIQMASYGFITIYSSTTVNGGVAEFMRLTDLGQRVLLELTTVRASPPGNPLELEATPRAD
jgi:hypothetical protein